MHTTPSLPRADAAIADAGLKALDHTTSTAAATAAAGVAT